MENLRFWLPLIYLIIALVTWLNFIRLPPDGLASLGLWLVVFPVLILDLIFRPSDKAGSSIFLPDGYGYYLNHAIFYSVSVALIAVGLFAIGCLIDRR